MHHESGEPIQGPIHPGQQGQEVFSEDYFSSARAEKHTGWEDCFHLQIPPGGTHPNGVVSELTKCLQLVSVIGLRQGVVSAATEVPEQRGSRTSSELDGHIAFIFLFVKKKFRPKVGKRTQAFLPCFSQKFQWHKSCKERREMKRRDAGSTFEEGATESSCGNKCAACTEEVLTRPCGSSSQNSFGHRTRQNEGVDPRSKNTAVRHGSRSSTMFKME